MKKFRLEDFEYNADKALKKFTCPEIVSSSMSTSRLLPFAKHLFGMNSDEKPEYGRLKFFLKLELMNMQIYPSRNIFSENFDAPKLDQLEL